MSLAQLAERVNYSKSYLSKIENDLKPPTADIAKRYDSVFATGGVLSAMVRTAEEQAGEDDEDGELWVMVSDGEGAQTFHRLPRRQVLAGVGMALGFALTGGTRPAVDEPTLAALRTTFDQYRKLGTISSPTMVLGPVVAHVNTLRTLAAEQPEPMRRELLLLASRAAEYAGWMSQEAGDETAALWWTRRAVEYAAEGGDRYLASYALVREAELAMYRQDPLSTIELAMRAQADPAAGPRILGLAARCEAQGHALVGDPDGYQRALDRATVLLSEARPAPAAPVIGSSSVTDEVALTRGWSLYDLGHPAEAAELLDSQIEGIAPGARRARARFGARRVLAHAGSGEIDHACELTRTVLADAAPVDSATVRVDLRELARVLARWHTHPAARELRAELNAMLRLRPGFSG
ncbi:helix-turn-helix transcriptional regulator [Amycolatopsis sp. OK19-0408]|uniref:Helix-turn-helix transcriptional regulator n=2 Tax=Amycolatopsis iheyensis TaxID=2945988 RepID=A0A9X2NMS3_9PSEU|nr:helix-turn-helix transcriptional regulator [Amycolatopsis iheyensis]